MSINIKIKDIVVVTRQYDNNSARYGTIGYLEKFDDSSRIAYCVSNDHIDKSWCIDVRLATLLEINAYQLGCTNIENINEYLDSIDYEPLLINIL